MTNVFSGLKTAADEQAGDTALADIRTSRSDRKALLGAAIAAGSAAIAAPARAQALSEKQIARFLGHASMGATRADINYVKANGVDAWLNKQFTMGRSSTRWQLLVDGGFNTAQYKNWDAGIDNVLWRKILSSPDTLRQRVTLALSEIIVTAVAGFQGAWVSFSSAHHMDTLEQYAFGNYRDLLQKVSLGAPMAEYLTFLGSAKLDTKTGATPDENYAREVMQLFTIGLVQLHPNGTPKLVDGKVVETYTQKDVLELAKVFTGFGYNMAGADNSTPDYKGRQLAVDTSKHDTGEKKFLGQTVPANTGAVAGVTRALDILFAHPNVAPFIGKQLIQRLVTSNPSPAYVARVAGIFNNDGANVKGNLKAVIRAVLLDTEAVGDSGLTSPTFGKVREPILRMSAWARAFNAGSSDGKWRIGNTSDPAGMLGQSPMRSPSVFNFFRPAFVPAGTVLSTNNLVAPEFQIANESTVIGYINYMQTTVRNPWTGVTGDYTAMLALEANAQALVDEVNLLLAAGQLPSATVGLIKSAIDTIGRGTDGLRRARVWTAILLTLASPQFIVQK